jgi:hypothetical protein
VHPKFSHYGDQLPSFSQDRGVFLGFETLKSRAAWENNDELIILFPTNIDSYHRFSKSPLSPSPC